MRDERRFWILPVGNQDEPLEVAAADVGFGWDLTSVRLRTHGAEVSPGVTMALVSVGQQRHAATGQAFMGAFIAVQLSCTCDASMLGGGMGSAHLDRCPLAPNI
jgi:hypothetical protein